MGRTPKKTSAEYRVPSLIGQPDRLFKRFLNLNLAKPDSVKRRWSNRIQIEVNHWNNQWGHKQEERHMALMILQVDFVDTRTKSNDDTTTLTRLAEQIKNTPGLIWKIWTENPETQEAGGIYLFENEAALETYRVMHTERLKQMGIEQVHAKKFQVNDGLTQITKGKHCLSYEPD